MHLKSCKKQGIRVGGACLGGPAINAEWVRRKVCANLHVIRKVVVKTGLHQSLIDTYVFNSTQFIKKEIREWVAANARVRKKYNAIHSTENDAEVIGHMPLFFSAEEQTDIHAEADRLLACQSHYCRRRMYRKW